MEQLDRDVTAYEERGTLRGLVCLLLMLSSASYTHSHVQGSFLAWELSAVSWHMWQWTSGLSKEKVKAIFRSPQGKGKA